MYYTRIMLVTQKYVSDFFQRVDDIPTGTGFGIGHQDHTE